MAAKWYGKKIVRLQARFCQGMEITLITEIRLKKSSKKHQICY